MKQQTNNFDIDKFYSNLNLSSVECINQGGCGVFAKALYKVAQEAGVNPTLVVLNPEHRCNGSERNMLTLLENDVDELHMHHIVVVIRGVAYDSEGEVGDHWYMGPDHEISYGTLCALVSDGDLWNGSFDRTQHRGVYKAVLQAA